MVRVTVGGATGKLGSIVCRMIEESDDLELTGVTVSPGGGSVGKELYPGRIAVSPDHLKNVLKNTDVYVDLTSPRAAEGIIADVPSENVNIVLGTTAVPEKTLRNMAENVRINGTSAVVAANFATGTNIFWELCGIATKYLKEYDMEILDLHHNSKKDAPSGTAKEIARILSEIAMKKEINIHSVRAGDLTGEHTVIFAGDSEVIEVTHKNISREALAHGCIKAIRWVAGRKDGEVHTMKEVLDL